MARTNFVQSIGFPFQRTSKSRYEMTVRWSKTQFFHSCFTSSRVEELYRFLNSWVPQLYGELDEEAIKTRGFELIQHDTEWMNNRTSSKVSFKSIFFIIFNCNIFSFSYKRMELTLVTKLASTHENHGRWVDNFNYLKFKSCKK